MAGRPKKDDKKIREAIYFEPELLQWLQEKAEKQKTTVSVIVNILTEEAKNAESLPAKG
ncbi:CopG family transcriptional regulator [Paenibacillus cymbidii]|uniref:CopG family transcriptional regulator n=1 Tax=Paenibacillus cymbidii TaxID=1639034 RepID=UPI001080CB56|nr:CopG family transcriptional regulator [Paenibacillus cymbidii]